VTTQDPQATATKACRKCKHDLIDKGKFCDNCGTATNALVSDWETLQHYCGRCGGVLRGVKKFCSYCGDASPHSDKKKVKHDHWIFQAAEDPKIQIGMVLTLVLLAALPLLLPVRYGLTSMPPFFLIYQGETTPVAVRPTAPLATASWSARSLLAAEDLAGENAVTSVAGVARDASGAYFLADTTRHVIIRISREGVRELIAGGGAPGFSGDGGAAIDATLNGPRGLAADAQGNLYVADTGNGRIRAIDSDGVIRTIAGCGLDCGDQNTVQAAALSVAMRPAELTFVGSNLLVTEQAGADSNAEPGVWVLQPEL
jgi:RNA polymerase subunit RPABC4/transcription elongation factor Spt4